MHRLGSSCSLSYSPNETGIVFGASLVPFVKDKGSYHGHTKDLFQSCFQ